MKYKIKYFGFKLAQMCQITPDEESEKDNMTTHRLGQISLGYLPLGLRFGFVV